MLQKHEIWPFPDTAYRISHDLYSYVVYEHCDERTCIQAFDPGTTQIRLIC